MSARMAWRLFFFFGALWRRHYLPTCGSSDHAANSVMAQGRHPTAMPAQRLSVEDCIQKKKRQHGAF